MLVHLVTIFPEYFPDPLACSVLRIAQEKKVLQVETVSLRDFADDAYRTVDDYPFGGGAGMVMKPEPIFRAVRQVRTATSWSILFSPQGRVLTEDRVQELAAKPHLVLICGHYKGVDQRVSEHLADEEVSIGDYVLSGGETAALVLLEAVARLLPGVVGDEESVNTDSFMAGLLDAPYYTRPRDFEGMLVPEVLVSGDHARVRRWRQRRALETTRTRRPDLFAQHALSAEEKKLLLEED
jgi:tRNA (guanine37-N1)-methyltransferase